MPPMIRPLSRSSPRHTVIIGGGLAGLAAALRLSRAGLRTTLVETRQRLGGRATSFNDPQTGELLDNCQHVLMRCCTALLGLYADLGVAQDIDWHTRFNFADGQGHLDVLEADDLPAPAHLARSLMGFKSLSWAQKIAISLGMGAMIRLGRARRASLHGESFARWLARHGQSPATVRAFWGPICVSALNEAPERCAADYAIQVFQDGFLCAPDAHHMGLSRVPLVRLYDRAHDALHAASGEVLLSTSAEALVTDAHGQEVRALRLADGTEIEADAFVSAVPADRLHKLCPEALLRRDPRLHRLTEFEPSPILGVHLWFEVGGGAQPPMTLPHIALTHSPLHWVFNKGLHDAPHSSPGSPASRRQHLHGVISAAYDLAPLPAPAIIDLVLRELRAVQPAFKNLEPVHAQVIKEKRATFSCRPGIDELRPTARGPVGNLYLAGDWCASGWPATMEGAVRSGLLAAHALLHDAHAQDDRPPVPAAWPDDELYQALSRR